MTTTQIPPRPELATPVDQGLVLDLDRLEAAMLPLVGGKAANLGELIRAGLPVPPGVCLTTAAYRRVAATAELGEVLDAPTGAPTDVEGPDAARLARLAGRARAAVLAAPVPQEVLGAVRAAYAGLGPDVPVAVRSSATAEDLPFASFAGQQDTYLNVVGVDAVFDAVRRCWASLWTDRAVSYRAANAIDHRGVELAVVVQRMVDAAAAGVLFTANPVTGRRHETVIDANPGLGEAVVSGAVNPDRFVVDTATGTIRERRVGDRRVVVRAMAGGGTEHVEGTGGDGAPCLTDAQVRDLAALGRRVEAYFGAPQDVEWALDPGGELHLTQARPITTLFPLPVGRAPDDGSSVYLCASLAQGLVRPITPMGLSAFRLIGSSAARMLGVPVADPLAGPPVFVEAGQRAFVDVTGMLAGAVGRRLLPLALDVMEARSAVVLRGLLAGPRFAVTRTSPLPFLRRVGRLAVRHRIPVRIAHALARPAAARRRVDRIGERLSARLTVPATAGAGQRLDSVERELGSAFPTVVATVGPVALGPGFGMLGMAAALLRRDLQPGDLLAVLRGLPHNVTTEMDLRLWDLARRIRADRSGTGDDAVRVMLSRPPAELARQYLRGELPAVVQDGLGEFLARYGHRAVAEIDLGMPRWAEDPTHVLGVLANYLRLDDPALAPDAQFARGAQAADEAVRRLVAVARRRGRLRGRLVGFGLRRARELAGLRETPKYDLVLLLAHARRQLAAVGAEVMAAGRLAAADDVFFLTLPEARRAVRGADLRPLVASRRAAYDRELRRRHIPRVLLSDGTDVEALATPAAGDGELVGTPASAGTATGTARVVLDPVGARLEPGEILVAPSTDPGWTPLFLTAGGLVMEMGGANSHGAVVAREYGIPAVVGVPDATSRIRDGQTITVQGATGTVSLD